MTVPTVVVVFVMISKDHDAETVDHEAEHGDDDRLVECDGHRLQETMHAFPCHHQCKQGEHHRARKSGQGIYLPGAETESLVVGVATREDIRDQGQAERRCVGRHVKAVGEQRHRSVDQAGRDFDDHRRRCQYDHNSGSGFTRSRLGLAEVMFVNHDEFPPRRGSRCRRKLASELCREPLSQLFRSVEFCAPPPSRSRDLR